MIVAKSRFWYFLRQLRKFKKTTGEIVSVEEIMEKKPLKIKNFGIWLRYDSRSGTHNMYRVPRLDCDLCCHPVLPRYGCPSSCQGSQHPNHPVEPVAASETRRSLVKQMHDSKIKFPLPSRVQNSKGSMFKAKRPNTYFL